MRWVIHAEVACAYVGTILVTVAGIASHPVRASGGARRFVFSVNLAQ